MTDAVFRDSDAAARVEARYTQALAAWPVPMTEHWLDTRLGPTFAISCGPEHAPPLVLLHGSQANSAAWVPDVADWSRHFRLVALDMVGEPGRSARVRPPLSGDAHSLWLDDVFEALGLHRFAIVGTSLGGWLGLDYAIRRPHAVSALALICPAGIGRQKNFLLAIAPYLLLGRWGRRRIIEKVFGPPTPAVATEFAQVGALLEAAGNAVKPRILAIPQATDAQLQALDIPVLAIVGGRDALLDSADTRDRLLAHAPRAEVEFLPDGYHFLPGQTGRVLRFLESVNTFA